MSSDHNVAKMVAAHVGHDLVVLYMVMYGVVDVVIEGDDEDDFEYERVVVYRKDTFWDSVHSDGTDCLNSDEDSTRGHGDIDERIGNDEGDHIDEHVGNDEDGDEDKDEDGDGDGNGNGNEDGDDAVNAGEGDADGNDGHHRSGEQIEESDSSEYKDDSD